MAPARTQVSPRTVWTVGLNVLLMLGTLAVLREAWPVISWILVALFVALALDPAVRLVQRKVPRRGWAVGVVFLGTLALLAALFSTLVPMVVAQARNLVEEAPRLLAGLQRSSVFQSLDRRFDLVASGESALKGLSAAPVLSVAGKIAQGLAGTITILSLSVFMLLFGGDLFRKLLGWFEPPRRRRYRVLARRMQRRVGGYVSGTFLIAGIGGVVVGVTLAALGNPYFLPLGLVMVVLGIIPWVGSALGALLVSLTTFAAQGLKPALIVLGIYLVHQQVENHLLQPLVQRHTIRMNPLLIALVMLVGTYLGGLLGALLSLPVAGAVQVVLQDVLSRRRARWRGARAHAAPSRQLSLFDRGEEEAPVRH